MKIIIVGSGKIKDPFASIAERYFKRMSVFADIERISFKDNKNFEEKLVRVKERSKSALILLDESGKTFSSREFADFLIKKELSSEKLLFAIGPADGFSNYAKNKADMLLSLSSFTFAHDFASAIFAEVLYRGLSIKAGHPYHRG